MNIAQEIERLRVTVPHHPNSPTLPRDERMIALYRTHSLKEVSEIMGCHLETVRYTLKKNGIPLRPRGKNMRPHSGHTLGMTWHKRHNHKIDCGAV
jgi:hypothetical protein